MNIRKRSCLESAICLIKVLSTLSEFYPELKDLKTIFTHFREDLEPHLLKEERILFRLKKFGVTKAEHKHESGFWTDLCHAYGTRSSR